MNRLRVRPGPRWLGGPVPQTQAELGDKLASVLEAAEQGVYVPFVVIHRATDKAIGWTTYMDIDVDDERLEIGWTWYGRAYWRTAVNTESKLLLLTHAFEDLGMGRVQLKTDHLNHRSQAAIERIGGRREGVLRRHYRRPDGTWRDTVYFSILADEWPEAKRNLAARLGEAGHAGLRRAPAAGGNAGTSTRVRSTRPRSSRAGCVHGGTRRARRAARSGRCPSGLCAKRSPGSKDRSQSPAAA
ncbi:acetyltransferase [Streptomyces noursei ATCC 11455]|nr:acetyltransferase [Streptomyces noursei ATCC 11455]